MVGSSLETIIFLSENVGGPPFSSLSIFWEIAHETQKTSTFVDDFAGKLCVVARNTWKESPNGDSSDAENPAQSQVDGQGELAAERVQEDKGLYNNIICRALDVTIFL